VKRTELRERLRAAAVELASALLDALAADVAADDSQPDALLTVAQLAARLHRSASTCRGWVERGEFTGAVKVGRGWLIPMSAVAVFLERQHPPPRAEEGLGRTIRPGADNRAGPRRARAAREAPDLSEWRRVRKAKP
jgi:excisionase family DNA binding protein